MNPLLTAEQSRQLDRDAIERLGVPGIVLMENAALGAWRQIEGRYPSALQRVIIVCGVGQNGGDGFALARLMMTSGYQPCCVLVGDPEAVQGDARVNLDAARALRLEVISLPNAEMAEVARRFESASLIVDALFGTGLSREVQGVHAEVITGLGKVDAPVVALDLPSGVCSDSGKVMGVAVRADLTVTFGARKCGLFQLPGAEWAGTVECVPIGVPGPSRSDVGLLTSRWVKERFRPRPKGAHKGVAGHVLVVGGAPGKAGAANLAGLGAMRAGAGLVTVARRAASESGTGDFAELMTEALPESSAAVVDRILDRAAQMQSVVLGPGLGLDQAGREMALGLMQHLECPVVVDADALTALAEGPGLQALQEARGPRVITPHPGEAGRLLGCSSADVQADRMECARQLAARGGHVAVLKGAYSIVAHEGVLSICDRGTAALAVAGTGDVLAGTIAALTRSMSTLEAAQVGVYLHAVSGEQQSDGDRGLLAREVAAGYPKLISSFLAAD